MEIVIIYGYNINLVHMISTQLVNIDLHCFIQIWTKLKCLGLRLFKYWFSFCTLGLTKVTSVIWLVIFGRHMYLALVNANIIHAYHSLLALAIVYKTAVEVEIDTRASKN